MRLFLGIDPGAKGGLAVLYEDGSIHNHHDMPLDLEGTASAKILEKFFIDWDYGVDLFAFLERVGPHRLGTKKNTWTFCINATIPRVVLSLLDISTTLVETKEFMKTLNLVKTKQEPKPSIRWAKEKYGIDVKDGISDALAIAEYGRLLTLGAT